MASINLDIINVLDTDRDETTIYKDLHLDLSLDYTLSNELEKDQQITDITSDNNVGAI